MTIELDLAGVPRVDGVAPDQALTSGEEYELLVAMPAAVDVRAFTSRFGCELTAIGRVKPFDGDALRVDGRPAKARGHDHFG